MSRSYRYINEYKNTIVELRKQVKTKRETCEKDGFTMKQLSKINQSKMSKIYILHKNRTSIV